MRAPVLEYKQVPLGMIVCLTLVGKVEPECSEALPLVFISLTGGVPARVKLYSMKDPPVRRTVGGWEPIPLTGDKLNYDLQAGIESFQENVRFVPLYSFDRRSAPADIQYLVYVGGELQNALPKSKYCWWRVRTDEQGKIFVEGTSASKAIEYEPPEGAVFVPLGRIYWQQEITYNGSEAEAEVLAKLAEMARPQGLNVVKEFMRPKSWCRHLHINIRGGREEARLSLTGRILAMEASHYSLCCGYCGHGRPRQDGRL